MAEMARERGRHKQERQQLVAAFEDGKRRMELQLADARRQERAALESLSEERAALASSGERAALAASSGPAAEDGTEHKKIVQFEKALRRCHQRVQELEAGNASLEKEMVVVRAQVEEARAEAAARAEEADALDTEVQELQAAGERHSREVAAAAEARSAERTAWEAERSSWEEEKRQLEQQLDRVLFDDTAAAREREVRDLTEKLRDSQARELAASSEFRPVELAASSEQPLEHHQDLSSISSSSLALTPTAAQPTIDEAEQLRDETEQLRATVVSLEEQLLAANAEHAAQCDLHIQELAGILEKKHAERAELVASFEEEKAMLEKQLGEVLFSAEADQVLARLKEQLDACETSLAEERAEVQVKNDALREADGKLEEMAGRFESAQVEHGAQCDRHIQEVAGVLGEREEMVAAFEEEKAGLERLHMQSLEENKADRVARQGEVAPLSLSPALSLLLSLSFSLPPSLSLLLSLPLSRSQLSFSLSAIP